MVWRVLALHVIFSWFYLLVFSQFSAIIEEQGFVYIPYMTVYISSCKSVDMRIEIVKYEEGFFFSLNSATFTVFKFPCYSDLVFYKVAFRRIVSTSMPK